MYTYEKYKQQKCPDFKENNCCEEVSPSMPDSLFHFVFNIVKSLDFKLFLCFYHRDFYGPINGYEWTKAALQVADIAA